MSEHTDAADDSLAAELKDALVPDDVPAGWRDAARGAFAWRTIDRELLALTYDSGLEAGAAVRGVIPPRMLEFSSAALSLEVELAERRVVGQLTGTDVTEVVFESADGRVRAATPDASGFFALDGEDHGLVRFSIGSGDTTYVTEWIVL